jgi:hypothetical protein
MVLCPANDWKRYLHATTSKLHLQKGEDMKDPQDCTYPQEGLCLHDCKQACQKRSGWRKVQIDDAEEEAWRELEKKNEST